MKPNSPSSFTVSQSLFHHLFIKKWKKNYLFIPPESRTAQKARTYFWEVCEHPWHCLWWQYYLHSLALLYLLKQGKRVSTWQLWYLHYRRKRRQITLRHLITSGRVTNIRMLLCSVLIILLLSTHWKNLRKI